MVYLGIPVITCSRLEIYIFFVDHLKEKLDNYVKTLPVPVHVLRIPIRGGLIRARLKGTTFLPSPIELPYLCIIPNDIV